MRLLARLPYSPILTLAIAVSGACAVFVCTLQGCGGGGSSSGAAPPAAAVRAAFPLKTSPDRRYLVDQNERPFPILGRTAWFITSLSEADYRAFIDDSVVKGFNAIEFHIINHDPRGNQPPFAGNGAAPFTSRLDGAAWNGSLSYGAIGSEAPDFASPNEAYWAHVDALLDYAESHGVLCFVFPAYTGFQGGDQGWMREMVANGSSRLQAYGAFIAQRYKDRKNIVWMLGGDYGTGVPPNTFSPGELLVEQALLAGLKSVSSQASTHYSAEWANNSIYTDQPDPTLNAAGTLEAAYAGSGEVTTYLGFAYGSVNSDGITPHPVMPAFLLEEPYDQEGPGPDGNNVNGNATQPVRRFEWWGWLSGIGGYIAGNGCVWPFNGPSLLPLGACSDGWKAHLSTQGANDLARLNAFIRSVNWFKLVPSGTSGMQQLILSGNSSPPSQDYISAAATPDGTLLVAYVPPARAPGADFSADLSVISGNARARWFNPASGSFVAIGTFPNTGAHLFTPPLDNGTGYTDWVLVVDKQ
jgi:hypothetical protein